MMQTTGRKGFTALGLVDSAETLREPVAAFLSAVKEWAKRSCNAMADRSDVEACQLANNGGLIGLVEVKALYHVVIEDTCNPLQTLWPIWRTVKVRFEIVLSPDSPRGSGYRTGEGVARSLVRRFAELGQ